MMKFFAKVVNGFKLLITFVKKDPSLMLYKALNKFLRVLSIMNCLGSSLEVRIQKAEYKPICLLNIFARNRESQG